MRKQQIKCTALISLGLSMLALGVLSSVSGCGYGLQYARNPILEKEGIERVYVSPMVNNTYKPGVENLVYNQLVRVISSNRRVRIVRQLEEADAVLEGTVHVANFAPSGSTRASEVFPAQRVAGIRGPENIQVATEYSASLATTFALVSRKQGAKGKLLWNGSFSRSKPFPANNQLGVFGVTSALINESEFDRALLEMAQNMMADVHENMLAMF